MKVTLYETGDVVELADVREGALFLAPSDVVNDEDGEELRTRPVYAIFDHQAGCIADPVEECDRLTDALALMAAIAQEYRDAGMSVVGSLKRTKCYCYGSSKGNEVNNLYIERIDDEAV